MEKDILFSPSCSGCGCQDHTHTNKADQSYHHHEHQHDHNHDHGHGHHHGHTHGEGFSSREFMKIGAGFALLLGALYTGGESFPGFLLFMSSYLLIGGDVVLRAVRNIGRGNLFDENFLMALATIGAILIGEYPEAVAVMLFYKIGEGFQDRAVAQSRKSISALLDIKPDYANLLTEAGEVRVDPCEVSPGSLILVKPGERIPLDGQVTEGTSALDVAALTGESLLRNVEPGDAVLSGSINTSGLLRITTTRSFGESTVSRIIDLVQNAGSKKAETEKFITRFARYYTPFVVAMAGIIALVPPLILEGALFSDWIYRALVFLVISCPCALVLSIPLGFFGGIGAASRQGILIKGGNYLEALVDVDTVIFDKTGTLTEGKFSVTALEPAEGITQEELLYYAALAESHSSHPIAQSILRHYGKEIPHNLVESYQELAGQGVRALVEGKVLHLGNRKLQEMETLAPAPADAGDHQGASVYLWLDGQYAGRILLADAIKETSAQAILDLKKMGVSRTVMLTGDMPAAAEKVAVQLGITQVYSQLLPEEKLEKMELLMKEKTTKGKVAFVGDGINDAPVLARADIGIAMGGIGSDAAIEAADVVFMQDDPGSLATAIGIARRTRTIVWQNIVLALGVKGGIMILGALGLAGMWEAVFADVGVALLAVLNSIRALQSKG